MGGIAKTPPPPYYAVIFTSVRTEGDNGYGKMAAEMVKLGSSQPGFLGAESVRNEEGMGITVSYWESPEAIENWKNHLRHKEAQQLGRELWYDTFATRVCKVDRHGLFKPPSAE
ncbi:MAG: antibiotic biosynthesis monooxygenase [Negativicutes bacterium]|nr:antibiotic biosynthesis monooxygenase [Negativicutes bacterium]